MNEKKILILSSNSFNTRTNNGKTLSSFFYQFDSNNVYQIFFHNEVPNNSYFKNYFRVSDRDVINRILHKSKRCGSVIKVADSHPKEDVFIKYKIKPNNVTRIIREIVWKSNVWKTKELDIWLNYVSPDVLFFVAGDGIFSYDIYDYIKNKCMCKTVIYITDDYILHRKYDVIYNLRRKFIYKKMKKAIENVDLLITISKNMQQEYLRVFNKKSIVLSNICENPMIREQENKHDATRFIYAGSIGIGRKEVLVKLGEYLNKLSEIHKLNIIFDIYTSTFIDSQDIKKLNKCKVIKIHKPLEHNQLMDKLNESDILVFVESFEKKYIEQTKLSFSTKIPEYLSLKKCILSIGSSESGSLEYLRDCSFYIDSLEQISKCQDILFDLDLRTVYAEKSYKKYLENHDEKTLKEKFYTSIQNL